MLSINNRLGFKEYKSGSEYKFLVSELTERLTTFDKNSRDVWSLNSNK